MTMEVDSSRRLAAPQGLCQRRRRQGRMLFVAGMIGWDAQGRFESDDFAVQAQAGAARTSRTCCAKRAASRKISSG